MLQEFSVDLRPCYSTMMLYQIQRLYSNEYDGKLIINSK
jgi:hypothetical protein